MLDLPSDPAMLLSVVNTKIRDHYHTLEALCEDMQVDKGQITQTLKAIDYVYDADRRQFV